MPKTYIGGKRVYLRKDGTYKGQEPTLPDGMDREVYDRYAKDGFNHEEIVGIWKQTLITREQMRQTAERIAREGSREITSSTYIRAQKRLKRDVDNWIGNKRG